MDEAANTANVDSPPQSEAMDDQVDIIAGDALRALWGHTILVEGQYMRIGSDGALTVKPAIAERLLKQSGWTQPEMVEQPADATDDVEENLPAPIAKQPQQLSGKNRKKRR